MVHLLDASGNPIKHGRPSPRTGSTGVGIQKFGTQQLKYFDSATLGVIEKDVGARTRLTFGGEATTPATPFSARYQEQRPATIRTQAQLETSPHAIPLLPDFGDFQFPDWFGNGNGNGNGKDCGWFGEKCWDDEKENGKDCGWFGEKCWDDEKENGKDCGWFGEKCWFEPPDLGWVKWVLIAIGIGILLWLLRPLFGIAKNITET